MKTLLTTLLVVWGFSAVAMADPADPAEIYDPSPLPPGPLVSRLGDYAQWQITYTYAAEKPPTRPTPVGAPPPRPVDPNLPRVLSVTRTKPLWHARLKRVNGSFAECWYDGALPILVDSTQSTPVPLMLDTPGIHIPSYLDFMGNRTFSDVDWVSPANYLGMQRGTTYWVFQQGVGGTKAWIDSNTRLPVKWQNEGETRTFEFPPAPMEKLVLPPDVARVSKQNQYIHAIFNNHPPAGA